MLSLILYILSGSLFGIAAKLHGNWAQKELQFMPRGTLWMWFVWKFNHFWFNLSQVPVTSITPTESEIQSVHLSTHFVFILNINAEWLHPSNITSIQHIHHRDVIQNSYAITWTVKGFCYFFLCWMWIASFIFSTKSHAWFRFSSYTIHEFGQAAQS